MIAFTSLQSIFNEYLKSESTDLEKFILEKGYARQNGDGLEFIDYVLPAMSKEKIDYKTIDFKKLGDCMIFLNKVKDELTETTDKKAARNWVMDNLEIAFTEGNKLGSKKDVAKLIKDFKIAEALKNKEKAIKLRKQHPVANKAGKAGKALAAGAGAAGIGGGIIAAALTKGAALSSIPGLSANAWVNFVLGATWGGLTAVVLGVLYYAIKALLTKAYYKAKLKGKKSIDLILNSDEDIFEMENVPSLDFLKTFAEKAADIIDYKPGKYNVFGKIAKYFRIKANRNRLHTIEKHFKTEIVAEIEKTLAALKNDASNEDLINKLKRLQSYSAVINSTLDDVAMEDYRDLLSNESRTRNATYMDIILSADKKQVSMTEDGRILNSKKFSKIATDEEKEAKIVESYNGKKPKQLKGAASPYGTSLLVKALSSDNERKSFIQARLEENATARKAKETERENKENQRKENKEKKKNNRHDRKIDAQIKPIDEEIKKLEAQKAAKDKAHEEDLVYKQEMANINERLTSLQNQKKELEKTKSSYKAKPPAAEKPEVVVETPKVETPAAETPVITPVAETPKVETPVAEKPEVVVETPEVESPVAEEQPKNSANIERIKNSLRSYSINYLQNLAEMLEKENDKNGLTKVQQETWTLAIEELRLREGIKEELKDLSIDELVKQAENLEDAVKDGQMTKSEQELRENLIGLEFNARLRKEQLDKAKAAEEKAKLEAEEKAKLEAEEAARKAAEEEKKLIPKKAEEEKAKLEAEEAARKAAEEQPKNSANIERIKNSLKSLSRNDLLQKLAEILEKGNDRKGLTEIQQTTLTLIDEELRARLRQEYSDIMALGKEYRQDELFVPYEDEEEDEVKQPAKLDETAAKIKELQTKKRTVVAARKKAADAAKAAQLEVERHTEEYNRLKTTATNKELQRIEKLIAKAQNTVEENNQLFLKLNIQSDALKHDIEDLKKSQRKSDLD